jgi:hypothetical protein
LLEGGWWRGRAGKTPAGRRDALAESSRRRNTGVTRAGSTGWQLAMDLKLIIYSHQVANLTIIMSLPSRCHWRWRGVREFVRDVFGTHLRVAGGEIVIRCGTLRSAHQSRALVALPPGATKSPRSTGLAHFAISIAI